VQIVGKTNLSELAVAPSGINDFFGTPRSPFSKSNRLIPGGSSCGSAVAIADGLADVALGTDTAIPLDNNSLPATSLQLVGPRCSEAELLNAGRLIEAHRRLN
jgi:Asp-tRNA(Asn)/Glu-tRNA(Gln) amidotransferase A subunit family amidase